MLCQLLTRAQRVPCRNARPFQWSRRQALASDLQPFGVRWAPATTTPQPFPANAQWGSTWTGSNRTTESCVAEPLPPGVTALVWPSCSLALLQLTAATGYDVWPHWWRWSVLIDGAVQGPQCMLPGCVRGEWAGHMDIGIEPYIAPYQWGGLEVPAELPAPLIVRGGQRMEFQLIPGDPDNSNADYNSDVLMSVRGWWWTGDDKGHCGCGC